MSSHKGDFDAFNLLLKEGANPYIVDRNLQNPLHYAVKTHNREIV